MSRCLYVWRRLHKGVLALAPYRSRTLERFDSLGEQAVQLVALPLSTNWALWM